MGALRGVLRKTHGPGKRQELTDVDGNGTQVKETSMKGTEELFEIWMACKSFQQFIMAHR